MIKRLSPTQVRTLALFAVLPTLVAASQLIPHEFFFPEMGALFTLSVYDVALAMIGLGLNAAQISDTRFSLPLIALFLCALLPTVQFTEPLLRFFERFAMDGNLYALPPSAVVLAGLGLWTPDRRRRAACLIVAPLLGLTLGLFIGLEDLAIPSFIGGAIASALWCLVAPSLLARHFVPARPLRIATRILGSWLVVIGLIVFLTALLPAREQAPADGTILPFSDEGSVPQE
ncbi:hypothetical protein PZN02_001966 [Sinorhizobium garamanticum]|uniref:Transmembrane protein n=1 Tax=Sinorhizobium garamanticum TaxID=680247 RepID=A0ABY8D9R5_9HYPH|nr:hypothetical protein [Sinorhizobium garamanticum]WEX85738.1 hypothetical protein PZN02_001966 [Sinorhizobium garamanticum]